MSLFCSLYFFIRLARGYATDNKDIYFVLPSFFSSDNDFTIIPQSERDTRGQNKFGFDFSTDFNFTTTRFNITSHLLKVSPEMTPPPNLRPVAKPVQMCSDVSIYNTQITAVMFNILLILHV